MLCPNPVNAQQKDQGTIANLTKLTLSHSICCNCTTSHNAHRCHPIYNLCTKGINQSIERHDGQTIPRHHPIMCKHIPHMEHSLKEPLLRNRQVELKSCMENPKGTPTEGVKSHYWKCQTQEDHE